MISSTFFPLISEGAWMVGAGSAVPPAGPELAGVAALAGAAEDDGAAA